MATKYSALIYVTNEILHFEQFKSIDAFYQFQATIRSITYTNIECDRRLYIWSRWQYNLGGFVYICIIYNFQTIPNNANAFHVQ